MNKIVIFSFILALAGCQSSSSWNSKTERSIANTSLLRTFIRELADQSKKTVARELEQQVERRLKKYLFEVGDDGRPNWSRMGITNEADAAKITSLYDDLPYMNKVQQWVMSNITVLTKEVKPSIARGVYKKILGGGGKNPYEGMVDDVQSMSAAARDRSKPDHLRRGEDASPKQKSVTEELQDRNSRFVASIDELEGVDEQVKKQTRDNSKLSDEMYNEPSKASNALYSAESNYIIVKTTGKPPTGIGCPDFMEKASKEIMEMKARVDMRRAELVEAAAYEKAGKRFNSISEVPENLRLTQEELDEITEQAFQDVLGYTRKEARGAIKRLRSPPCMVY